MGSCDPKCQNRHIRVCVHVLYGLLKIVRGFETGVVIQTDKIVRLGQSGDTIAFFDQTKGNRLADDRAVPQRLADLFCIGLDRTVIDDNDPQIAEPKLYELAHRLRKLPPAILRRNPNADP